MVKKTPDQRQLTRLQTIRNENDGRARLEMNRAVDMWGRLNPGWKLFVRDDKDFSFWGTYHRDALWEEHPEQFAR
jgi:hypothetical protein